MEREMNLRRFFLEAATIVVAAILCAMIANLLAARERKLVLVGSYPNALVVPKRTTEASAALPVEAALPAPTSTVAIPPAQPLTAATTSAAGTTTAVGTPAPAVAAPAQPAPTAATKPVPAPAAAKAAPDELLARFPVHEGVPFVEISSDDAAWLYARGALFLDARRTGIYEQGHIAGARSFPVWESDIDARVADLSNEGRDQKLPIVVYCSGGDCEDSNMLAQKLWGLFFNNVLVYKDGFPDWQKRGGAVSLGSQP
jgi:rhodanese-related sulfurtransferase